MSTFVQEMTDALGPEALLAWLAQSVPALIKALLVMVVFWGLWRLIRRGVQALKAKGRIDATLAAFLGTALKVTVLSIGLIMALGQLGVNTTSLLASFGVAGIAFGFASKDALSNVIAGLFIFWDRPFVVGDLIENQGYYGRVADITLRSTRVVTPDGKMLAIPNSAIVNTTVASYTNFPNLRLDIPVTIGVGEDIGKVRKLLLDLVEGSAQFMKTPAPTLSVDALNDYNLLVTFSVWLVDEKTHVKARADLRELVFETLRSATIDMPYETLQLMPLEVKSS